MTRLTVLLAAVLALAAPAAASAAERWLDAETVASWASSSSASHVASGLDADGGAVLVATTPGNRLVAYERVPGGAWEGPVDVGPGRGDVRLAVGAGGTAAVLVKDDPSMNASFVVYVRSPDGTWSSRTAPGGATTIPSSRVAVGADGQIAIAYNDWYEDRPFVYERGAAGTWDLSPKRLDDVAVGPVDVGIDGDGSVTVAWARDVAVYAGRQAEIMAAGRAPGAGWPAIVTPAKVAQTRVLSHADNPSTAVTDLALAAGADGDVVIAWRDAGYFCSGTCSYGVAHAVARTPEGAWGAPERISDLAANTGKVRVAVDAGGDATVAWTYENPTDTSLHYADRGRDDATWTAGALDLPGYAGLKPSVPGFELDVNDAGDAVAAWTIDQNGGGQAFAHAMASVRPAGGAWELETLEHSATRDPVLRNATAAVDADGNVLAGWQANGSSPSSYAARTAIFDAAGPRITAATVPDGGQVGQELSFSVQASDISGPLADEDVAWTFGAGQGGATGMAVTHTYDAPGTYTVSVQATDASGLSTTRTWPVVISDAPNVAPTADFTVAPATVQTGETVAFDARASDDPDGTIVAYEWDFDGGGGRPPMTDWDHDGDPGTPDVPLGDEVELAFSRAGEYPVRLRVRDDDGEWSAPVERPVTVTNRLPTASFTAPAEAETGEEVTLDASASSDPEGTSLVYEWDLDGDGPDAAFTAAAVEKPVFATAGARTVRLRVRDEDGGWSAPAERTVTVTEPDGGAGPGTEPGTPDAGGGAKPAPPRQDPPPSGPPAAPSPPPAQAPSAPDPTAGLKLAAPPFTIVSSVRRRAVPSVVSMPVDRAREVLDARHYVRYAIDWVHKKPSRGSFVIGDVVSQSPAAGEVEDSAIGDFLRMRLSVYAGPRNRSKECAAGFRKELPGTDFDLGHDLVDEARCVAVDDIDFRLSGDEGVPGIAKAKVGRARRGGRELDLTVDVPRDDDQHDLFLVMSEYKPGNLHTFGDDWALTVGKNNCFRVQVFDRDRALIQHAEVRLDASDAGAADPPRLLTDANGEVRYCAGSKHPVKPAKAATMDIVAFATGRNGETLFGASRVKAVTRKGDYRTPSGRQVQLSTGRYAKTASVRARAAFDLGGWLGSAWATIATPFKALGDGIGAGASAIGAAFRQGGWARTEEALGVVPGNLNPGGVLSPKAGVISAGAGNVIAAGAGNVISAGAGNVISAGAGNVISAGGGNVISAGALSFIQSALSFLRGSGHVISAGAGNVISAGAGNVISAGAGNVIAAGGGNVISAGGGNVISAGAGNVISAGAGNLTARAAQAGQGAQTGFRATARGVVLRLSNPSKGAEVPVGTGVILLGEGEFAAGVKDARKSDVLQLSDDVWVLRQPPAGER